LINLFSVWCQKQSIGHPEQISRPILESYQHYLHEYRQPNGRPLSISRQQAILISIRHFFRWLAKQGYLPFNPSSELDLPRKEQRLPRAVLTPEEIEVLIGQPDINTLAGLRDRVIMELLYATGMRRLELVKLCLCDINKEKETVFIHQGKGKKDRIVPLGERALSWVLLYMEAVRPRLLVNEKEEVLILNRFGNPYKPHSLSCKVLTYLRNSPLDKKQGGCHIFRHSMASIMLENGADVRFIQEILGHRSLETTQLYTKVSIERLKAIHKATHPGSSLDSNTADF